MASRRCTSPEPVSPSADKENSFVSCSPRASSPQKIVGGKRCRYPLEDYDPNSQDSGYEASYPERDGKPRDGFQFVEPLAVAPRRMSIERSPMASPVRSSPQRTRAARSSLFRSVSSGYESMDDGFNDLIDMEALDDTTQLPNGISTLLSGDIVGNVTLIDATSHKIDTSSPSTPEFPRTNRNGNFRRSLSLQNERPEIRKNSTLSKVRSCLFRSPKASPEASPSLEDSPFSRTTVSTIRRQRIYRDENATSSTDFDSPLSVRTFKRPDPPMDDSPKLVKRSRRSSTSFLDAIRECTSTDTPALNPRIAPVPLQRSLSETATTMTKTEAHALIKSAIHRSITDADLTGDFSKPCVLPLATGQHEDLKSISTETLAALIRGDFRDRIGTFQIVDCRYPYEYDAGHIQGAQNLYSKDLIERILLDPITSTPAIEPDSNKRNILVFHCEFSWERGPNLSRFLRNLDRQRNKEHYPALHYPEVYLLHGGYEQFYREQKTLCTPQGYRPMRHPDNEADLRQFRSKSKSWQGEKLRITGTVTRSNLKRLGF
ncbi:M-phase inducer phosphatase-like isoform X4 [Hylaeus anthracinus]|nr:M-phase inducer phosphatase-like isoform X4 [Hylaeus anthracinus]XP_053998343.1 M-phase inducer phosphatase-like isoform X4 [Hylaeus anthracinus]XP_053998352.1 M-phase inducer phosphatase-like isoform X4 [Hylaeus anthracinus]